MRCAPVMNIEALRGEREYIMASVRSDSLARTFSRRYSPWIRTHTTRSASLSDVIPTECIIQHDLRLLGAWKTNERRRNEFCLIGYLKNTKKKLIYYMVHPLVVRGFCRALRFIIYCIYNCIVLIESRISLLIPCI